MIRVYCAGKIGRCDWRHTLFPLLDDVFVSRIGDRLESPSVVPHRDGFLYGGPFFCGISGHGLTHGAHSHGLRELTEWDAGADHDAGTLPREKIPALCLEWLRASDVMFAWIEDLSAYGTLAEIGYAVALKKPVYCAWPREMDPLRDWWFVQELAREAHWAASVEVAWSCFSSWAADHFYVRRLRSMPYDQYLQTTHWKTLRLKKLDEAGRRCQLCNAADRLDVHHRTYERRGEELLTDLIALCRPCHAKFHNKPVVDNNPKAKPDVGKYPLQ